MNFVLMEFGADITDCENDFLQKQLKERAIKRINQKPFLDVPTLSSLVNNHKLTIDDLLKDGKNPFSDWLWYTQDQKTIEWLFQKFEVTKRHIFLSSRAGYVAPVRCAACSGNIELLKLCLKAPGNLNEINLKYERDLFHGIHDALKHDHLEAADLIYYKGGKRIKNYIKENIPISLGIFPDMTSRNISVTSLKWYVMNIIATS